MELTAEENDTTECSDSLIKFSRMDSNVHFLPLDSLTNSGVITIPVSPVPTDIDNSELRTWLTPIDQ